MTDWSRPFSDLPATFGRYRVEARLGEGSMGTVWSAIDTLLGRQVAIKIHKGSADNAEGRRFLREARAAAKFQHPNLCPVYDVGQIGSLSYLTMPLIKGGTLSSRLSDINPISTATSVNMLIRLARAIAVAHAAGVLHRDIKPSNIMLDDAGEPIVMDFGVARVSEVDQADQTASNLVVGTPTHLAPEVIQGEEASAVSDVYGLGVVGYQMLTGKLPFRGSLPQVLQQMLTTAVVPPSALRADVSTELDQIVIKAIAIKPADRWQNMNEFASALQNWQQRQAIHQTSPSTLKFRATPQKRTRSKVVPLVVAGVILVIAMVGGAVFFLPGANDDSVVATPTAAGNPESNRRADAALLPEKSLWLGEFSFHPPLAPYVGSASLEIVAVDQNRVNAVYATEEGAYRWEIEGEFTDGKFHFEFIKVLAEPEPRNLIGNAVIDGEVVDDQLIATFFLRQDSTSVADLKLTRR